MIQIKRENLDALSEKHFNAISKQIKKKLDRKKVEPFIFIKSHLKDILVGKPPKLEWIISNIPSYEKEQNTEIEKIFNYEGFKKWKAYDCYSLAESLNVNVCPYCNRQYTFTLIDKGTNKGKTRPDFDHFFSQSSYPYLALSFYNLIPSCTICNSTFKGKLDWRLKSHLHPYEMGFDDKCKFSLKIKAGKGVDFFYGNKDAFEIDFKKSKVIEADLVKIDGNIRDLHLKEIYNEHKDYVREIIQKSLVYSDSYLESIFTEYEGTLFASYGELQRMVLTNYIHEEDLEKRVLSKLSKDIAEELGLI